MLSEYLELAAIVIVLGGIAVYYGMNLWYLLLIPAAFIVWFVIPMPWSILVIGGIIAFEAYRIGQRER